MLVFLVPQNVKLPNDFEMHKCVLSRAIHHVNCDDKAMGVGARAVGFTDGNGLHDLTMLLNESYVIQRATSVF